MPSVKMIPQQLPNFIEFGSYSDIRKVILSGMFMPTFVTGLARSGKTTAVQQACSVQNREMVRVNFTIDTDEDDLLGGLRLIDGNTVWSDGPVTVAMKRGAILLLDEVDLGTHKCMCLQPILEGSPIYIKKNRETVYPHEGFNIIATANTKGQGDPKNKFLGTQLLNEAFLDRFSITLEHEYPPKDVEMRLLMPHAINTLGADMDRLFVERIVSWARGIRRAYLDDIVSDNISTGRLIHMMKAYHVFKCPHKAVRLCVARFDDSTKDALWESFTKEFPFEEGAITSDGAMDSSKFIKMSIDSMDTSEFNTKFTRDDQ